MTARPQDSSSATEGAGRHNRRRWFAGLAALGGFGLLAGAAQARGWGLGRGIDPEEMARRMEWRIGRMVSRVGGSTEQRDRIVAIVRAAMADLRPMREQMRQARKSGMQLLAVPVIDRGALERLRAAQIQQADGISRRMTQALADAADVLTPEQRAKIAEHFRQRMERR